MQIERILRNDIIILTGHRNEGKSTTLYNIIIEYLVNYPQDVWTFGIKRPVVESLSEIRPINMFWSIREMEKIQDSLIIADEAGDLLNVINRKQHEQMLKTLRAVAHQNNIIVLCSLPFDFKKIFAAQARCFLYKGMNIQELINGSLIKETLMEYKGHELGAYRLNIPKQKVLCYDEAGFWMDDIKYYENLDTKAGNVKLLKRRVK
jgi:hypothetical protein